MSASASALEARGGLPPRDAWLIDPFSRKFERITTPTDDRGLVIVEQLIPEVLATLDPAKYQPTEAPNEHHFYWEKAWYDHDDLYTHNASHSFRNLGVHKGMLPVLFHNWLHRVTLPPPVPEIEVIEQRIDSWRLAQSLFAKSRNIVSLEYLRRIAEGDDIDFSVWEKEMVDWEYMQEAYRDQFEPLQPRLTILTSPDRFPELASEGPAAMYQHLGDIAAGKPRDLQELLTTS